MTNPDDHGVGDLLHHAGSHSHGTGLPPGCISGIIGLIKGLFPNPYVEAGKDFGTILRELIKEYPIVLIIFILLVALGVGMVIGHAISSSGEQPAAAQNKLVAQAILEPPRTCEAVPPSVTIPSLDYLRSIPPSKARDVLSATSGQFQHYRRYLGCLNEQIEFDRVRLKNEAPSSPVATARSRRISEWNNRYDREYDRRTSYQQRFRALINEWCRIDVETVGCLQQFPT